MLRRPISEFEPVLAKRVFPSTIIGRIYPLLETISMSASNPSNRNYKLPRRQFLATAAAAGMRRPSARRSFELTTNPAPACRFSARASILTRPPTTGASSRRISIGATRTAWFSMKAD